MSKGIALRVIVPMLVIASWWAITETGLASPLLLPRPSMVLVALWDLITSGVLMRDLLVTLFRVGASLCIGVPVGVSLGILIGLGKMARDAFGFLLDFFRSIPATALFPLFTLLFGIGNASKISLVAFTTSLVIAVSTASAAGRVRERAAGLISRLRYRRADTKQVIRQVIVPASLPEITAGVRVAISLALILVIVTEMFFGTDIGLGARIIDTQLFYKIPHTYATVVVTGLVGYGINELLLHIAKRYFHWVSVDHS